MSLRKILEETFGQIEWQGSGGSNEPVVTYKVVLNQEQLNLAHQQILALIPKKKASEPVYNGRSELIRYDPTTKEIAYNEAISEITHNLTKEE